MILAHPSRRWVAGALGIAFIIGAVCWALTLYRHGPNRGLPSTESFSPANAGEWTAYGGTWSAANGSVVNDSDERGAKLLTGSEYWENYSVEADLKLLGINGNAGLMIRSTNADLGVDSYRGYYAGIRKDGFLTLGRADHGWSPIAAQHVFGGIHSLEWYHLRVLAYGCEIVASVAPLAGTALPAAIAVNDPNCVRAGQIGLRSYSSGGIWRNVRVRPVTYQDLTAILPEIAIARQPSIEVPASALDTAAESSASALGSLPAEREAQAYSPNSSLRKIGDLRLTSPVHPAQVNVRGTVILTEPELFIQDSTGGVSVPRPNAPPLKIGDEVEARGIPEARDYSAALKNATVHLLWEREPLLPLAVTAAQAATGSFDATFIELDGYLQSKEDGPNNTTILNLTKRSQSFQARMANGGSDPLIQKARPHSLLRLRGICVVDPAYTRNLVPFVLLLPSAGDIDILVGPPWWSKRHLIAIAFGVLLLALIGHLIYSRVERWKMRAVFEQRELLAHEMHDTLAQSFAGLGFQLQAIRNRMPWNMPEVHQQLDLACDLVRHSHEEARRSIAVLRPETLEPMDLAFALERCAKRLVDGGTVPVDVSQAGTARPIPMRITDALFRIGQEALANAVQHARPTRIGISVYYAENALRLAIEDDGEGFIGGCESKGLGVQGMRKRAAAISAGFEITSAPGHGTCVLVRAPIPPRVTLNAWPTYIWRRFWQYRSHEQTREQSYSRPYRR